MVSCLEEIELKMGYIQASEVRQIASDMKDNRYGKYLSKIPEVQK